MHSEKLRIRAIKVAAAVIAIAAAALFIPSAECLTVSADGKILFTEKISPGDCFSVTYNHSVNRSPVKDTVEYTGDALIVRSSLFQTFGAGIPIAEDGGTLRKTEDGLLLSGIDRSYRSLDLMTGTYADHHLLTQSGKDIQLKAVAGEQRHVVIHVMRLGLFRLFI